MQTHDSLCGAHPAAVWVQTHYNLYSLGAVISKCRHTTVCVAPLPPTTCSTVQFGCSHKQMQTHCSLCRTHATHYSLGAVISKCRCTTVCVAPLPPQFGCSHKQLQTHDSLCRAPAHPAAVWVQTHYNLYSLGAVTSKCRHTTVCVAPLPTHYSLGAVISKCRHTTVCVAPLPPTTVWVQSQAIADTRQFVSHPCHPLQFGCSHKQMQTHCSLCRTPATHYSLAAVISKCRCTTVCVACLPPTTVWVQSQAIADTQQFVSHTRATVQFVSHPCAALQFAGTVTTTCRCTALQCTAVHAAPLPPKGCGVKATAADAG